MPPLVISSHGDKPHMDGEDPSIISTIPLDLLIILVMLPVSQQDNITSHSSQPIMEFTPQVLMKTIDWVLQQEAILNFPEDYLSTTLMHK